MQSGQRARHRNHDGGAFRSPGYALFKKIRYMNESFNLMRRTDFERPFGDIYFPSQPSSFSGPGFTAFQRRAGAPSAW